MDTSPQKYPFIMRLFHWIMAVIITGMILLGFLMSDVFSEAPFRGEMVRWHKSIGVTVLILLTLRLFIRLKHRDQIPALSNKLPWYERVGAALTHKLLYSFMLIMPLSGYLMSSASPKSSGTAFFGLPLPNLIPKNEVVAKLFAEIHEISAFCLIALIVLHIAGAIKHRYFDDPANDVLSKMW